MSSFSFARESINALKREFDKGFLQEVLNYFGLSVEYTVVTPTTPTKRDDFQVLGSTGRSSRLDL
jgi:hypothetical protein